jgi:hypothetical protein
MRHTFIAAAAVGAISLATGTFGTPAASRSFEDGSAAYDCEDYNSTNMSEQTAPRASVTVKQPAFRQVVDEFITAARSGDTARMERLISPMIASRTGKEAVERYLAGDVRRFFGDFEELGRSITVAGTEGVSGQTFYMYKVTRNSEYRPFVIQVIEEAGQNVVSNILVDRFVEGRHCAHVGNGWKCPDFR